MKTIPVLLLLACALVACSGPDDVLENIGDVTVPEQLTGCVIRDGEACLRAVCVADEENDCEDWVEACEEHDHIVGERGGHATCERMTEADTIE